MSEHDGIDDDYEYEQAKLYSCSTKALRFVVCAPNLEAATQAAILFIQDRFDPNTYQGGLERNSMRINRRPIKSIGERPLIMSRELK